MNSDALPIIAWDNQIEPSVMAIPPSSGDASGFPSANVGDWRPYERWKASTFPNAWIKVDAGAGNTITASILAIMGHNLATIGATFTLDGSDDDASWVTALTITPSGDRALAGTFPEASYRYWRLLFSGETAAAEIGIWFLGPYIQFPDYCLPGFDPQKKKLTTDTTLGQTGELLGTTRRFTTWDITANFGDMDRDWVTLWITPMENTHYPKPFFWVWDEENHPEDVFLLRCDKPEISHAVSANLAMVSLEMTGRMEP